MRGLGFFEGCDISNHRFYLNKVCAFKVVVLTSDGKTPKMSCFFRKFQIATEAKLHLWHHVSAAHLSDLLRSVSFQTSLRPPFRANTIYLVRSLDQLNSMLCGFNKHLPLNIMSVQGISAEFRGTSVFPPIVIMRDKFNIKSKSNVSDRWRNVHHSLRPLYGIIFNFKIAFFSHTKHRNIEQVAKRQLSGFSSYETPFSSSFNGAARSCRNSIKIRFLWDARHICGKFD